MYEFARAGVTKYQQLMTTDTYSLTVQRSPKSSVGRATLAKGCRENVFHAIFLVSCVASNPWLEDTSLHSSPHHYMAPSLCVCVTVPLLLKGQSHTGFRAHPIPG